VNKYRREHPVGEELNLPEFTVTLMCAALEVSRSGYYEACSALPSARRLRRAKVGVHVLAAFEVGRGAYGVRRVHAILSRSDDPQVASASLSLVVGWSMAEHMRTSLICDALTMAAGNVDFAPGVIFHLNPGSTPATNSPATSPTIASPRQWEGPVNVGIMRWRNHSPRH